MKRLLSTSFFCVSSICFGRAMTASAPDWPPFFIHDNKVEPGMGWEILSECGSNVDSGIAFDIYPIRRMFKYMEEGKLDLNIMSFKPDRVKIVDYGKEVVFSNTYAVWVGVGVRKAIRKIADLDNLSLAQLVGLRPSDQFKDYFSRPYCKFV